jgi:hypothetical protein
VTSLRRILFAAVLALVAKYQTALATEPEPFNRPVADLPNHAEKLARCGGFFVALAGIKESVMVAEPRDQDLLGVYQEIDREAVKVMSIAFTHALAFPKETASFTERPREYGETLNEIFVQEILPNSQRYMVTAIGSQKWYPRPWRMFDESVFKVFEEDFPVCYDLLDKVSSEMAAFLKQSGKNEQ